MTDSTWHGAINRRRALTYIGATAATGLAGCLGGGDGGDGDGGGGGAGDGSPGGSPTPTPEGTPMSGGEWPDLSGTDVHFITGETGDTFRRLYEQIASDFEDATGASVTLEFPGAGTPKLDRIAQLLQAGDPPEAVQASLSQAATWVEQDVAANVDASFDAVVERYGEPGGGRITQDGSEFNLPVWTNVNTNWYRGDIYDEAPDTWEKNLAQAEAHDDPSGVRGSYVPTKQDLCVEGELLMWAYTNDARVCRRGSDGKVESAIHRGSMRDRWIEVLDYLGQLHEFSPNTTDAGCAQMIQAIPLETTASSRYPGARPKLQSIEQEKPFAADVHPTRPPENRSRKSMGFVQTFNTFQGSNVEAGNVFLSFALQEQYFVQMLEIDLVHNNPVFTEITNSQQYQQSLATLPDTWSDDDVSTALAASDDFLAFPEETSPPNPFTGQIFGSQLLSQMLFDVTVRDVAPADAVDQYGAEIQAVLDEAQS